MQAWDYAISQIAWWAKDLTNHRTVKIGGWAFAWGLGLARDDMTGYILGSQVRSLTSGECEHDVLICVQWS